MIVINGKFLTRKITGVERYAYEILLELDKIASKDEIVLAVPKDVSLTMNLSNIKMVTVGHHNGIVWEQIELPIYIMKNKAVGVHLCNVAPLIKPDIVCIHDMNIRANPWNFRKTFVLWYRLQFFIITHFAKHIITVSEFSKSEIRKYYSKMKVQITIVGNGWQHMKRIKEDNGIFDKLHIDKQELYYFAMSSMTPNKNLPWILRTAKIYSDKKFIVAGKIDTKVFGKTNMENLGNVVYAGYVSDGEAKALMCHCKAFLFPSYYEGFGIPPMEALSVGANIICSDIPVLHEVYGDSAVYVDPDGEGFDDASLLKNNEISQRILSGYSYEDSAYQLYEIIRM